VIGLGEFGESGFQASLCFWGHMGVQVWVNVRGEATEGVSDLLAGGVGGKAEGFEGLLEDWVVGVRVLGIAGARSVLQEVGGMQVGGAGIFSGHGVEAQVGVLEMEEGVEAKSVLETQPRLYAFWRDEACVDEHMACEIGGLAVERGEKLAMLVGGEVTLLQEDFADGRDRQRGPHVRNESVAQGNEVVTPTVGSFVTDEFQLTPNLGAMQSSQHVPEGGGPQPTWEDHDFRVACGVGVGQVRHPALAGVG
jgi:hypothetical protein